MTRWLVVEDHAGGWSGAEWLDAGCEVLVVYRWRWWARLVAWRFREHGWRVVAESVWEGQPLTQ